MASNTENPFNEKQSAGQFIKSRWFDFLLIVVMAYSVVSRFLEHRFTVIFLYAAFLAYGISLIFGPRISLNKTLPQIHAQIQVAQIGVSSKARSFFRYVAGILFIIYIYRLFYA